MSIIQNVKFIIQELLSINILNLENSRFTVISRNIQVSGIKVMSLIIRLTMKEIMELYQRYREFADKEKRVIFGGRLGGI